MTRTAGLVVALVALLALPLGAGAEADPQRAHDQILRGLGLEPGLLPKKVIRGFRYREARPIARSLGSSLKQLRPRAFLPGPSAYGPKDLLTLTKAAVEQSYSALGNPDIRPVTNPADQQRAHSIYWRLAGRLHRELGVGKSGIGPLLVLQGGPAEAPGACSLANGSMILHRGSLELADGIARAMLSARSKHELLGNLLSVALNRVPEGTAEGPAARAIADGVLAVTVGHEMTHGLKRSVAQGRPQDVIYTPFGTSSKTYRAAELVADAGGTELALRGGFSPQGVLGFYLYRSVLEAYTGALNGPLAGTHPRSHDRYRLVYRYVMKRAEARRPIYDGIHLPREGAPYLSAEARNALRSLPTPEELDEYLLGLPHGMGYLHPRQPPAH